MRPSHASSVRRPRGRRTAALAALAVRGATLSSQPSQPSPPSRAAHRRRRRRAAADLIAPTRASTPSTTRAGGPGARRPRRARASWATRGALALRGASTRVVDPRRTIIPHGRRARALLGLGRRSAPWTSRAPVVRRVSRAWAARREVPAGRGSSAAWDQNDCGDTRFPRTTRSARVRAHRGLERWTQRVDRKPARGDARRVTAADARPEGGGVERRRVGAPTGARRQRPDLSRARSARAARQAASVSWRAVKEMHVLVGCTRGRARRSFEVPDEMARCGGADATFACHDQHEPRIAILRAGPWQQARGRRVCGVRGAVLRDGTPCCAARVLDVQDDGRNTGSSVESGGNQDVAGGARRGF
jgi:hypothetical protein